MKSSLKNYSVQAGLILILLAAFLLGFNLYKIIAHLKSPGFAQILLFSGIAVTLIIKYNKAIKES
ncbi:hypothetical protein CHRYSEOSP005_01090 [Chryseobacterium sp. Alg-005]|uniref:hypothetical protein n=1 Tax=Chryseobacterium sp. Alg-005 TaxID=3159516 RepID=UPI0035558F6D